MCWFLQLPQDKAEIASSNFCNDKYKSSTTKEDEDVEIENAGDKD